MPDEKLEPDQEALDAWEKMPKGTPSKEAMPPLTGGMRWVTGLIVVFGLLAVIIFIVEALL